MLKQICTLTIREEKGVEERQGYGADLLAGDGLAECRAVLHCRGGQGWRKGTASDSGDPAGLKKETLCLAACN